MNLPAEVLPALRLANHRSVALSLLWATELRHLLTDLRAVGVRPLLLKGTPLAFSCYPQPGLRPRTDTDLLIRPDDRAATYDGLRARGYRATVGVDGDYVSYQCCFIQAGSGDQRLIVDLHWRINNSQLLAPLLSYDELLDRAHPVPALGPLALAPAPADALLLACLHRAGHLADQAMIEGEQRCMADRLIWLYDIHLLVKTLNRTEDESAGSIWGDWLQRVEAKRLRDICRDGLQATANRFATPVPGRVWQALRVRDQHAIPVGVFHTRGWRRAWRELGALSDWRARERFVRENLFPSPTYMRHKYPERGWLALRYLQRIAQGVWRRGR